VGLAFANHHGVRWGTTVRRSATLLVVGLLYNAVVEFSVDPTTWRVTGPLASYALLGLLVGVGHRWLRTPRAWLTVTVALAAAETAFMVWWGDRCVTDALTPDCNPSGAIDPTVLGASHLYRQGTMGYDPEGLVAFVGLLLTACVGVTAGHVVLRHRGSPVAVARILALLAGCLAAGSAIAAVVEPFKKLWTPSFALLTAAVGLALLVVGISVFDLPNSRRYQRLAQPLAWPVAALGRNSLLVYFGSHALVDVLGKIGNPSLADRLIELLDFHLVGRADIGFLLAHAALWWLVAVVMHRRGIYITASGIKRDHRRVVPTSPSVEETRVPEPLPSD
jgi:predicted acyltransferase